MVHSFSMAVTHMAPPNVVSLCPRFVVPTFSLMV
uniref:Uncharacterized protein n=1 Tax=Arundo donax TaxID=35708 RepID=A0A0A8ZBW4_ARUDO